MDAFRCAGHALVDGVSDHLAAMPSRPVWQPVPADLRAGVVSTRDEMRATVDWLIAGGAGVIKLIVTGAVLTQKTRIDDVELEAPLVEAAVAAAAAHGVYVCAHAHGSRGIAVAAASGEAKYRHQAEWPSCPGMGGTTAATALPSAYACV